MDVVLNVTRIMVLLVGVYIISIKNELKVKIYPYVNSLIR
jgi:hypothetical protein